MAYAEVRYDAADYDFSQIRRIVPFGTSATAKNSESGKSASNVFDGSTATRWSSYSATAPQWLRTSTAVTSAKLRFGSIVLFKNNNGMQVKDFVIEGSDTPTDDNSWVALTDTYTVPSTASNLDEFFFVAKPDVGSYTYFRISVSSTYADGVSFYELNLWGE